MSRSAETDFNPRSIKSGGDVIAAAFLADGVQSGLTAGTTQTQAGAVVGTHGFIIVAVCANANDGLALPVAENADGTSKLLMVTNDGVAACKVWPATDGTINGGSADAADATAIPVGETRIYRSTSALNWERLILEDA